MKLSEIINKIETEFPVDTAYEWDNPGLLAGDATSEINTVLISLDITESVVDEAIKAGAELILSHHPIFFGGTKKITSDNPDGRAVLKAIRAGINIYAAHTNCDVGKNGINAKLAKIFQLTDIEYLEENGLGRIGNLKHEIPFYEFAETVKKSLNTPHVRVSGKNFGVKRIAIGSGACSDSIPTAISKGADVMITADMKYHEMINMTASGINLIDAGHYPTEIIVTDIFSDILSDSNLKLIKSAQTDIFKYI